MLAADIAFIAALLVMTGANLIFAPRIGERVAMQWSLRGEPTWTAPKLAALWGPVALAVLIRLAIFLAMTYAPDKVNGPEIGVLLFSTIVAAVHFGTLYAAARKQQG
jgi:hypothetical protein